MFFALSRVLESGGYGSSAVFDLHPRQLLALVEAAWERERQRRGLPQQGLLDPEPALRGFGSVETATGQFLGDGSIVSIAQLTLQGLRPSPALAWAWLVEGAGLVELLSALVLGETQGKERLRSPGALRWLRNTEELFSGSNLLTLRSLMRGSPVQQRAALYTRAFGAPVQAEGVWFTDEGFIPSVGAALNGDAEALAAARELADGPLTQGREAFAAVQLVSWFYLSLQLPDSPVAQDLGLAERGLVGRLAGLADLLNRAPASKAGALLLAAESLNNLLRSPSGHEQQSAREALAQVWPGLEGALSEDPETGAGDLHLASMGAMELLGGGAVSFGGDLEPDPLRVIDQDARVRTDPPALALTSTRVPCGADVLTRGVYCASGTYYVKVQAIAGGAAQWTKLANLRVSPPALVGALSSSDNSQTGPFAAWSAGRYVGQMALWLVGGSSSSGLVLMGEETLLAYLDMYLKARDEGVELTINSGFRSYPEQKALRDKYLAGSGALAAKPGYSNHQSGLAIDISVKMPAGNANTKVSSWTPEYRWLVKNARLFGFMRTVSSETWHWEHRPDEALNHDTFGSWTALKAAGG